MILFPHFLQLMSHYQRYGRDGDCGHEHRRSLEKADESAGNLETERGQLKRGSWAEEAVS